MCHVPLVTIHDAAILRLEELNRELHPRLKPHPVPQSDPRAKGLMVQFTKYTADEVLATMPVLYSVICPQLHDAAYILAVNQTPPTDYNDFAMRPHIDRRWTGEGFTDETPVWTTVMFLNFPALSKGGELVLFDHPDEQQMRYLNAMERQNGRTQLDGLMAQLVTPMPGRACRFPGPLPHAVLGYDETEDKTQRLSIVLAEFGK